MTPKQKYNEITANRVIQAFKKRNIEGYYCADKAEALKKALEIIPEGSSVTWGGSQSIAEIGLCDSLKNGKYELYDRAQAKDSAQLDEIYRKAFSCNFYISSSNAVTLDGKLVNIDGIGNRVSAIIFGPDNVLLIVGINKVCDDEADALKRVKNKAAVMNAYRLNLNTPCSKTGSCVDCLSDECICSAIVVTRRASRPGRIKVIIVGEELGY